MKAYLTLACVSLLFFMVTALTFSSLGAVLPAMISELHLSNSGAGWGYTLLGIFCGITATVPVRPVSAKYLPDYNRGDDRSRDEEDPLDARTSRIIFRCRRCVLRGRGWHAPFRGWPRFGHRVRFHFIHGVCPAPLSSNRRAKNPRCGPRYVPIFPA